MLDDDLLGHVDLLEDVPAIAEEFRDRYRCFVVDEFQDVTPAQQRLLSAWLGRRDDLTVVGDVNQTIYSFAGAEPDFHLGFANRYPNATVVRLESDYRSTPQVVELPTPCRRRRRTVPQCRTHAQRHAAPGTRADPQRVPRRGH